MGRAALPFSALQNSVKRAIKGLPLSLGHIGDHIKKKRLELGLTQKDVAVLLNLGEDTITYWENHRAVPMINHYPLVIKFLGYNPCEVEDNSLVSKLVQFRKIQGLSCKKLGKLLSVDASTIRSWELDKCKPQDRNLKKINKLL
jgi:DNA-binding transcriptional regulator YiaG